MSVESFLTTKTLEFLNCGKIEPLLGFNSDGTLNSDPVYGFKAHKFSSTLLAGGSFTIVGEPVNLGIDTVFTGVSTVINNRTYYLGQSFTAGVAQPEVAKYSGNTVYVDNRPSVTRSSSQKEDVKIILPVILIRNHTEETNLNVILILTTLIHRVTIIKFFSSPYPVQGWELNNLQSILQNQVEDMGTHFFKEGGKVIPGQGTYLLISMLVFRLNLNF